MKYRCERCGKETDVADVEFVLGTLGVQIHDSVTVEGAATRRYHAIVPLEMTRGTAPYVCGPLVEEAELAPETNEDLWATLQRFDEEPGKAGLFFNSMPPGKYRRKKDPPPSRCPACGAQYVKPAHMTSQIVRQVKVKALSTEAQRVLSRRNVRKRGR